MFTSQDNGAEISAYFDRELSADKRRACEAQMSAIDREILERYTRTSQLLRMAEVDPARVAESERAVWQRLQRSMPTVHNHRRWWLRSIPIPVPVLALALLVFGVMIGVVGAGRGGSQANSAIAELAGSRAGVDVRIQVEAEHTPQLLEWLNQQQQVRDVKIELPDTGPFSFRGQPAYFRPSASNLIIEPWHIEVDGVMEGRSR